MWRTSIYFVLAPFTSLPLHSYCTIRNIRRLKPRQTIMSNTSTPFEGLSFDNSTYSDACIKNCFKRKQSRGLPFVWVMAKMGAKWDL